MWMYWCIVPGARTRLGCSLKRDVRAFLISVHSFDVRSSVAVVNRFTACLTICFGFDAMHNKIVRLEC